MSKRLLCTSFILGLFIFVSGINAQSTDQKRKLLEQKAVFDADWKKERAEAEKIAVEKNFPIRKVESTGEVIELQKMVMGVPLYFTTQNDLAAQTISTRKTYLDEEGGYSLSGAGVTLGVWDGGGVRMSHREFQGRAVQKDNPSSLSQHSTHVAGTMMAGGVEPEARGMSYKADLHAYEWNNDLSELTAAAANGLKVSNHSYGLITGWRWDYFSDGKWAWFGSTEIDSTIDYRFGYYDDEAAEWDKFLYTADNLLVVKSAGNDRGDGPNPGEEHWAYISGSWVKTKTAREIDGGLTGFDCIGDGRALAKNTLTVGAVAGIENGYAGSSSVKMSSFSSWGPTDDGRIKPDVVADGVSMYSSSSGSDNEYAVLSGTSMATPSASGSVGILLEQQKALYGESNPFKSATMKALILHTADEAGSAQGPDYTYGWGLMNTLSAVKTLTVDAATGKDNLIKEETLTEGSVFEYQVVSNGIDPVKATIVWTDPAGKFASPSLNNRKRMLINDLDLRIIGPNGENMPWKLDPNNPSAAAVRGDNNIDNVEQVIVPNTQAGTYTIKVTHKDSLMNNSQDFSLIVTGKVVDVPGDLTLLLPLNGTPAVDTKPFFKWTMTDRATDFNLQVSEDSLFTSIVLDTITPGIFNQAVNNLPETKKLYWRVRAKNSGGFGNWSEVWSFETRLTLPGIPQLITPAHNSKNLPSEVELVWSTNSTVEFFHVMVATNLLFTNIVFNDSTIQDTSYTLTGLQEGKRYYWKVKGKNSTGTGEFTEVSGFSVKLNTPEGLSGTVEERGKVTLTWTDKSSAETKFYILRKNDGEFEQIGSVGSNKNTYTDTSITEGVTYEYAVYCANLIAESDTVKAMVSVAVDVEDELKIPAEYTMSQNFPNPFNPTTTIKYGLPKESSVKIQIYNTIGEIVFHENSSTKQAGVYSLQINASKLASGIYFYSIDASPADGTAGFREVKKMILMK